MNTPTTQPETKPTDSVDEFDRVENRQDPNILLGVTRGACGSHRMIFHKSAIEALGRFRRIEILISESGFVRLVPGLRGHVVFNSEGRTYFNVSTNKLRQVRRLVHLYVEDVTIDKNGITFKWPSEI